MIFRGKAPEATVWRRFRSGTDGFTFQECEREDGGRLYEAHVVANAERVVDLLYTLSEQLTPAVDVLIQDKRNEVSWSGQDVALPDVRDAIARLKVPLSTYGGVEVNIYSADDQLSLTAYLGLYVFSRSDKWLYLLQGIGLEQYSALSEKQWRILSWDRGKASTLDDALEATVQRLSLTKLGFR
jgi:hypothetical protein